MSPDDRYDVSGLSEAQFESGSDGLVLKNLLGITSPAEMDIAEANALVVAVDRLVRMYDEEHRFTANDICEFHRVWLRGIYAWAGEYLGICTGVDFFSSHITIHRHAGKNSTPALWVALCGILTY